MHHWKNKYQSEILPKLKSEFNYKNDLAAPWLIKIVVNMGINDAVGNRGIIDKVSKQIALITGQKPLVTKARKAISAFKLRKGMAIGVKVTLRGKRMLDFWDKLVKIVLPRQRDFKGISTKGFDGLGNLNIGLKEQTLFPDIEYDQIDRVRGIEITIVTSTQNDQEAQQLLELMGMPFIKVKSQKSPLRSRQSRSSKGQVKVKS